MFIILVCPCVLSVYWTTWDSCNIDLIYLLYGNIVIRIYSLYLLILLQTTISNPNRRLSQRSCWQMIVSYRWTPSQWVRDEDIGAFAQSYSTDSIMSWCLLRRDAVGVRVQDMSQELVISYWEHEVSTLFALSRFCSPCFTVPNIEK